MIFDGYSGGLQVFAIINYILVNIFVRKNWLRRMIRNHRLPGRSELFWTLVDVRYMSTLVTVVAFAHGVAEGAREAFLPDDISPFCGRGDKVLCWDCWDPAEEFKLEGVMPGNKGSRLRKCGLPMNPRAWLESHTLSWQLCQCQSAQGCETCLLLQRGITPECSKAGGGIAWHSQFPPGGLD